MHSQKKRRLDNLQLFQTHAPLSIADFQQLAKYHSRETARKTVSRYRDEQLITFVFYTENKDEVYELSSLGKKYIQELESLKAS